MALVRIPALASMAWALNRSLTSPTPPVPTDQQKPSKTLLEKMILSWVAYTVIKTPVFVPALAESAVILAEQSLLPVQLNTLILHYLAPPHRTIAYTPYEPVLFIGTALALVATWFRLQAYSAMGKQFTFEVTVQKEHKLITTFPYNIVRHPSYIAQFFVWIGMFTALSSPDGWTRTFVWGYLVNNGGVAGILAAIVMGLVVAFYLAGVQMCTARTAHEDGLLRETFGKEWDEWAKNVPYRLVPGVY